MVKKEDLERIYKKAFRELKQKGIRLNEGDLICPNILALEKNLKANEMIYLCSYYTNHKSIEKADEFAKEFSKKQLYLYKKRLCELGFIEKVELSPEELKTETIKLSHKGNVCEWCGKRSYVLQKHHFPIPSKEGGKETVDICPNCHCTFHLLEGKKYK